MNKNAFTLIELLAVIVILAIVALISIPMVLDTIEKAKEKTFITNNEKVLDALELYLTQNEGEKPVSIGETKLIELSVVESAGYLKSGGCSGYIMVTKLSETEFMNKPVLDCNGETENPVEDKLEYYYSFDEFQEPTENIATGLNLGGNYGGGISYNYIGIEDGWHKYAISGTGTDSTYPYSFHIRPAPINSNHRVSFSFKYKTNVLEKYLSFGDPRMVNIYYKSGGIKTDVDMGDYYQATLENVAPDTLIDGTPIIGERTESIYFLSRPVEGVTFDPTTDFLYFKDIQAEVKPYTTPFTENTREGLIKDLSGNEINLPIELAYAPTWQDGYYTFDGVDDQVTIPNINITENIFTVSFWIKPDKDFTSYSRFITPKSAGYDQFIAYYPASDRVGLSMAEKSDVNERRIYTPTNSVPQDEWSMVVISVNNSEIKMYVNGELVTESNQTLPISLYSGEWTLGSRGIGTYFYKGSLDELTLYKRILSPEEIKNKYNVDIRFMSDKNPE